MPRGNLSKKELKEIGVASRSGYQKSTGVTVAGGGMIQCRHCGNFLGNLTEVSRVIGVGASTLAKWLRRQPVRSDVAETIRSSFARVEE